MQQLESRRNNSEIKCKYLKNCYLNPKYYNDPTTFSLTAGFELKFGYVVSRIQCDNVPAQSRKKIRNHLCAQLDSHLMNCQVMKTRGLGALFQLVVLHKLVINKG